MLDDDKREILQSSDSNILPLSLDIIEEPKKDKDVSPDIQEKVINENNGDDVISRIKAQNILLKICCLCFIVCTIVNIFMFTKKDRCIRNGLYFCKWWWEMVTPVVSNSAQKLL